MSRWSVTDLGVLTEQQIFDRCVYHMVSNGGAPAEVLMKPEAWPFVRRRRWRYIVKQGRAPLHGLALIEDLESLHRDVHPDEWPDMLAMLAKLYNLRTVYEA